MSFKELFSSVLLVSFLLLGSQAFAQDSNLAATVKMSGVSPAVGVSYHLDNESKVRALGFFSTNTAGGGNYLLDLSYLRNAGWVDSEDIRSYWGANLGFRFDTVIISPGLVVGSSYSFNDNFAIFGEAGLNIFIVEGGSTSIGMFNSGVGLNVAL